MSGVFYSRLEVAEDFLPIRINSVSCTEMDISEIKRNLERFEAVMGSALEKKYKAHPKPFRDTLPLTNLLYRVDLLKFVEAYIAGNRYPMEYLHHVSEYCMDYKLQLYYLLEVDMGLYNTIVYRRGYDRLHPENTPDLMLVRQSLDQSLIMKSRILWERAMNLIFHLETGKSIENMVSGNKSKRKVFSEFLSGSTQWQFMAQYMAVLSDYEQKFRSPESHKKSVLRAELMGNKVIDSNDLLDLVNYGINTIWTGILSAVEGKPVLATFKIEKKNS